MLSFSCLFVGWKGIIISALLCSISRFLHPRHYTVPCIMQNTPPPPAISAMDVRSSGPC